MICWNELKFRGKNELYLAIETAVFRIVIMLTRFPTESTLIPWRVAFWVDFDTFDFSTRANVWGLRLVYMAYWRT